MKSRPLFVSAYTEGLSVFEHAVHRLAFQKPYNKRIVEVKKRRVKLEFYAGVFSGVSHVTRRCAVLTTGVTAERAHSLARELAVAVGIPWDWPQLLSEESSSHSPIAYHSNTA